jgi:DNA-binding NarL/FixJ family response regulator
MSIKIAIFEDNSSLRESLAYLIRSTPEYELIGDYPNAVDASTVARVYKPDVVLMDIDMAGGDGIKGVSDIKESYPQTAVIMYTVFEDEEKLFKCLCAGADGYLLKKTNPEELFRALSEASEGGAPMSPSIAKKVLASFKQRKNNRYQLSERETEVLTHLAKGYSSKMIAAELNISFDTARFHLKNIYRKLHVNCGKEAISKALSEHIV